MRNLSQRLSSKTCQAQAGYSKEERWKVKNAKLSRVVAWKICKFVKSLNAMSSTAWLDQGRTQRGGLGLKPPFELDVLQNFITCATEINCFRMLVAC